MLFKRLTEKDIERTDSYRRTFAGSCENQRADLSTILKYWNKNKEWMAPYFGDSLIKEIPIEYKEGEDELYNKINDLLYHSRTEYRDFIINIQKLYPYPSYRLDHDEWNRQYKLHEAVCHLTSTTAFVENKVNFSNENFVILELPNGVGEYKIQNGAKLMRVLRKFAEALNFKEFEDFRNDHSRCLQTKSLKGDLCLSIHPLDFMTMSDNECGWQSCMSWRDNGEYRLGTVEMMNSSVVICAYLKSDRDILSWRDTQDREVHEWNSKKWRCLFIVDYETLCMSVKSYPFYNSGLIQIVMQEIAKLFDWGEREIVEYDYHECYRNAMVIDDQDVSIECDTGAMYNDCGSTDHWLMLGPKSHEAHLDGYTIDYSGEANCMCCGCYVNWEEDCADTLTCDGGYEYCSCCDERMNRYSDDWYWVEDERVCDCCCSEHAVYDPYRGDYIWNENAKTIYLSRSDNKLTNIYDCKETHIHVQDKQKWPDMWNMYFNIAELRYDDEINEYYVYPKDCTTAGLRELFDFYGDTERWLKEYMEEYKPNELDGPDEPTVPDEPKED